MTRLAKILAISLAFLAVLPRIASAQSGMLCAERDMVLAQLNDRYGEEVRGMGLSGNNRIVEVFVSEETGTWTITMTSADGTMCLMAAGLHFEDMVPQAPGENL